jgi:hypothetical protein
MFDLCLQRVGIAYAGELQSRDVTVVRGVGGSIWDAFEIPIIRARQGIREVHASYEVLALGTDPAMHTPIGT